MLHVLRPLRHTVPRRSRSFLTASASPIRFTTSRTLPFPPSHLYQLVSDIDSYSTFLPYCTESTVTRRHPGTDSPVEADLRVGWGSYDESFRSKVTCKPESGEVEADASENPLFETLKASWKIGGGCGEEEAEVRLGIEVQFTNSLYAAVGGTVAPKVAEVMVEAFEKRAREILGKRKAVKSG